MLPPQGGPQFKPPQEPKSRLKEAAAKITITPIKTQEPTTTLNLLFWSFLK